jgi:hypothetical protein
LVEYVEELEAGVEADPGPDGLSIVPGLSPGVSKEVRRKCETVTKGGRQGRGFLPPTAYDLLAFQQFSLCSVL